MVEKKTVSELIGCIRASKDEQLRLLEKVFSADGGRIFGVDLVVRAVLQRSFCLIDGFSILIEQRNLLCAAPLLRLQIDSLIRLYACWLVENPHSIAECLFQNRPLNRIKSRDGEQLSDGYLWKKASEHYPWIGDVYKAISGFIHLSTPHMLSAFHPTSVTTAEGEATTFIIAANDGPKWSDSQLLEVVAAFYEATGSLYHLCWSWLLTKERAVINK